MYTLEEINETIFDLFADFGKCYMSPALSDGKHPSTKNNKSYPIYIQRSRIAFKNITWKVTFVLPYRDLEKLDRWLEKKFRDNNKYNITFPETNIVEKEDGIHFTLFISSDRCSRYL